MDDHEENLLALEAVLTDPSYELVRANSGRAALREVLRGDFAVVLLDVAMPDMDGYETATLIRERQRSRETPDHLPHGQLPQRGSRLPRLLGRGSRLSVQALFT